MPVVVESKAKQAPMKINWHTHLVSPHLKTQHCGWHTGETDVLHQDAIYIHGAAAGEDRSGVWGMDSDEVSQLPKTLVPHTDLQSAKHVVAALLPYFESHDLHWHGAIQRGQSGRCSSTLACCHSAEPTKHHTVLKIGCRVHDNKCY